MKRLLALCCALACSGASFHAWAQADLVLVNGRIHTLDAKSTVAEALAVKGERIVAVGNFARVKLLVAKSTRVVDLNGRTVNFLLVFFKLNGRFS